MPTTETLEEGNMFWKDINDVFLVSLSLTLSRQMFAELVISTEIFGPKIFILSFFDRIPTTVNHQYTTLN